MIKASCNADTRLFISVIACSASLLVVAVRASMVAAFFSSSSLYAAWLIFKFVIISSCSRFIERRPLLSVITASSSFSFSCKASDSTCLACSETFAAVRSLTVSSSVAKERPAAWLGGSKSPTYWSVLCFCYKRFGFSPVTLIISFPELRIYFIYEKYSGRQQSWTVW